MAGHSWVFWTLLIVGSLCWVGFIAGLYALYSGWFDE